MKWIFQNLFAIVPHFDLKMIHNSFLAKIPRNSAMHSELSSVILPYWSRIIFFPIRFQVEFWERWLLIFSGIIHQDEQILRIYFVDTRR